MHYSGSIISLIGVSLLIYSKMNKRTIQRGILDLSEERQTKEFTTPVKSELKIKLNGKKEIRGQVTLTTKVVNYIQAGTRPTYVNDIKEIKKGNDTISFNLDSGTFYFFIVQPEPFEPFIVEYKIVECNPMQDQLFTLGVALTVTGLGIAFS